MPVGSLWVARISTQQPGIGLVWVKPLHEGELNGVRIADKSYMQELVQPNASSNGRAYGYQVWLNRGEVKKYWPDLPEDAYGFTGNRGQAVMIFPSEQAVMVRLGWSAQGYLVTTALRIG